jgi:hypothetical protein
MRFCSLYQVPGVAEKITHHHLNNKKLLQGVQGGGFLEKSPPGRRRQKILTGLQDMIKSISKKLKNGGK